jgi:F-type H+-transporting ATPase subunit epsilon
MAHAHKTNGSDDRIADKSDAYGFMRLSVVLPDSVLFEAEVIKVAAEATNGSFAILPRHIDYVAPISAGLILVTDTDGRETILATDEGTLVKCAQNVSIATRRAAIGDDLRTLRQLIETEFRSLDEHEASARAALARLESDIVRRFIELEESR